MVANRGTSLKRGLEVLGAPRSDAAVTQGGLGGTEIAAMTGHEKSQVSRARAALSEYGLAERTPGSRAFRLGWDVFTLASRAGEPRLIEESRLALSRLVDEVGEAAHRPVVRGRQVLTVLTQDSPPAVAGPGRVGWGG